MKKCLFVLCLTVSLSCTACGSTPVDQDSDIESDSRDTISYEEQVKRENTIKEITEESLSDVSSGWLVSTEDPISVFIINDKVDVTVKVISSDIIPRTADDICEPVVNSITEMGYDEYEIIVRHIVDFGDETSGAVWSTKDGVTGLFVDNERETAVFQSGVSIDDLYSYYEDFERK